MTFRNPDVEIHMTGWPALIFSIGLAFLCLGGVIDLVRYITG